MQLTLPYGLLEYSRHQLHYFMLWGSRTASVIGSIHIPVITIPYSYAWKKPEKILLVTNHFENEAAILNPVFELANLYRVQLEVAVFTDADDDKAVTYLEHIRQVPRYEKMLKEQYKEETLMVSHLYGLEFEETLQNTSGKSQ